MDQLLQENWEFFTSKVAAFKAPPLTKSDNHDTSESDTIIAARVRPLLPHELEAGELVGVTVRHESGHADLHQLRHKFSNKPPKLVLDTASFPLDKSYGPNESSEYMYNDLVKPLVPWAWGGGVSTVFAYGQTGSGKTYNVALLQQLVATDLMTGNLDGHREIYISVCELIGHNAFDLLNDRRPVRVLEDSFGETQLVGALEHSPKTTTEFLNLLAVSSKLRQTQQTTKNDTSSRSHAVCRLRIVNPSCPSDPDGIFFLIDLAGSELASDVRDHDAARMKETREINVSLSTLKDCIRGRALYNLGGAVKPHVPFRSSVLTKVLKHVFDIKGERSCKTMVLACVKPNATEGPASKNTLRFAELLRVPMPKRDPEPFHPLVPRTWSHEKLVGWIEEHSGTPPISATHLAPTETGAQLIKLPKATFATRCLKTSLATEEQARAFYDKLWKLHIDSRGLKLKDRPKKVEASGETAGEKQRVDWRERMRPGMALRLKKRHFSEPVRRVVVLCPEGAFDSEFQSKEMEGGVERKGRYVCAAVFPAIMADAYLLSMNNQSVVSLDEMEDEIELEFDHATRFYFMTV